VDKYIELMPDQTAFLSKLSTCHSHHLCRTKRPLCSSAGVRGNCYKGAQSAPAYVPPNIPHSTRAQPASGECRSAVRLVQRVAATALCVHDIPSLHSYHVRRGLGRSAAHS